MLYNLLLIAETKFKKKNFDIIHYSIIQDTMFLKVLLKWWFFVCRIDFLVIINVNVDFAEQKRTLRLINNKRLFSKIPCHDSI